MTEREKDLLFEGITALKEACRATHKGGPGGQAICICGASCGGSAACRALKVFRDLATHGELDEDTMVMLQTYL